MVRFLGMICCWMALLPAYAAAPSFEGRLEQMLSEYQHIQATPDVGVLVRLDEKMRDLIEDMRHQSGQSVKWKNEYSVIGVEQGDGLLIYSGRLLAEAHRLNPNSPYRERTLCFAIIDHNAWGAMPDLESINIYLKEFPHGYCARDAHRNLATFYSDLYNVLVELQDLKYEKDYKYECFAPYISAQPYRQQAEHAKALAIAGFERTLASKSQRRTAYWSDTYVRDKLNGLRNGEELHGWFWCAD